MSELTHEDGDRAKDAATLRAEMQEARAAVLAHQRGEIELEEHVYKAHLKRQISIMLLLNQSTAGPKKQGSAPSPRAKSTRTAPILNLSLDDL